MSSLAEFLASVGAANDEMAAKAAEASAKGLAQSQLKDGTYTVHVGAQFSEVISVEPKTLEAKDDRPARSFNEATLKVAVCDPPPGLEKLEGANLFCRWADDSDIDSKSIFSMYEDIHGAPAPEGTLAFAALGTFPAGKYVVKVSTGRTGFQNIRLAGRLANQ